MKKADYSRIAPSYDKGRSLSEQNIELWLKLISKYSQAQEDTKVLDLGCGTGRFTIPMANQLQYRMVGADYSKEMLDKAQEKDVDGMIEWDYQDAQGLSYRDESFDLVFISHLLHHVDSPTRVLIECKRVLTTSGVTIVRYGAIEQIEGDVEHTFFPGVLDIDKARTPSVEIVEKWLSGAGFSGITTEEVIQQTYETGAAHLKAARAKNTSVLTMIPQEAFEKGIDNLTEYIKNNPDDTWLLVDRLTVTAGYSSDISE